jgi:hypothetical protein
VRYGLPPHGLLTLIALSTTVLNFSFVTEKKLFVLYIPPNIRGVGGENVIGEVCECLCDPNILKCNFNE